MIRQLPSSRQSVQPTFFPKYRAKPIMHGIPVHTFHIYQEQNQLSRIFRKVKLFLSRPKLNISRLATPNIGPVVPCEELNWLDKNETLAEFLINSFRSWCDLLQSDENFPFSSYLLPPAEEILSLARTGKLVTMKREKKWYTFLAGFLTKDEQPGKANRVLEALDLNSSSAIEEFHTLKEMFQGAVEDCLVAHVERRKDGLISILIILPVETVNPEIIMQETRFIKYYINFKPFAQIRNDKVPYRRDLPELATNFPANRKIIGTRPLEMFFKTNPNSSQISERSGYRYALPDLNEFPTEEEEKDYPERHPPEYRHAPGQPGST